MAEYTANAAQTVAAGSNVLFTDTVINGCCNILHRNGSGLVTLRGGSSCKARYRVTYGGNIADSTTVGAVSLAIAANGEALQAATMIATPAAAGEYFNVSATVLVDVPKCCCTTVSVTNNGTLPLSAANSNIVVERVG